MAKGRKTGGRQKGVVNKLTGDIRQSIIKVYEKIGGDEAFAEWAQDNRRDFYPLYVKLIPKEVNLGGTVRLEDIVSGGDDPDNEGV
jgi:hypothetical protein